MCFPYRLDNDGESQTSDIAQLLSVRALRDYAAAEATLIDKRKGTLNGLVRDFTLSPEFGKRADSTQKEYRRMLTKVAAEFGTMPIAVLEDPRVKGDFLRWRELSVTSATAAAIDAHVMACITCRTALAEVATLTNDGLMNRQSVWDAILERVDRPTRSFSERLLGVMRVRPDAAKLLATTPALRLAWLAAMVLVAAFAAAAARVDGGGPWLLLVIAPLLPVAGVATAYGPAMDPTYEIGIAAPMSGVRLTLLRTLAVITTTMPLLALAALAAPGHGWAMFGWVLPSFALVAITLALSTVIPPERAGVVVGTGWMIAVVVLIDRNSTGDFVEKSLLFSSSGQTVVAVIAVIGAVLVVTRKACFDVMTMSGGGR